MNIAIKLPNDLDDRVLSFPFLHTLNKILRTKLEEDEVLNIHLISLSEGIDVLNLLPFNAFYHDVEKEDLKTVFSVHRSCMNLKIDQVDIYISTTESFVDASIGKNLFAKKKIGFSFGKNGWFFSEKVSYLQGRHRSDQIFELLRPIIDELPEIPNVYSRELSPVFADWNENPYILINLDLVGEEVNSEWTDFFDLFVNKIFVLMSSSAPIDLQKDILDEFVKKLSTKNTYKVIEHSSYIEFGKLCSYCLCFISHDSPLINISAYCGTQTFYLQKKDSLELRGSQYFVGAVRNFSLKDPLFSHNNEFIFSKIFDELYSFIEEKSKAEISD